MTPSPWSVFGLVSVGNACDSAFIGFLGIFRSWGFPSAFSELGPVLSLTTQTQGRGGKLLRPILDLALDSGYLCPLYSREARTHLMTFAFRQSLEVWVSQWGGRTARLGWDTH